MARLVPSLLVALLAAVSAGGEPIRPAALGPCTMRFTYEARVTPPVGAREVEVWLPLPREDDQRVLDVRLAGIAPATIVRLSPSGDRAAYLRIAAPKGTVTLTETGTVGCTEVRAAAGVLLRRSVREPHPLHAPATSCASPTAAASGATTSSTRSRAPTATTCPASSGRSATPTCRGTPQERRRRRRARDAVRTGAGSSRRAASRDAGARTVACARRSARSRAARRPSDRSPR